MQKQPVFICGLARSGTSWLANSLEQSEDLVYLQETWLLSPLKNLGEWYELIYQEWGEFTPWQKSGIDQAVFYKHMGQFYLGLLNELSEGQRFLEKTPVWNLLFFDTLKNMFPNAYFIFLYRDGRNCVASAEAKAIAENKPFDFESSCNQWVEAMSIIARLPEQALHQKIHIVRYEDLVQNFRHRFSGICEFIEIEPFVPDETHINSSFENAQSDEDFNSRWREWSSEKQELFLKIAEQELIRWNYLPNVL